MRRRDSLFLLAIALLAAALRLYHLNAQSLWIDEADIYQRALQHDWRVTLGTNPWIPDPPLHHLLLHFWLKLRTGDWWARLLSAIFGIAAVPMTHRLIARTIGRREALVSAFLVAISPFAVWYSQEVRMYSLFLFLVTCQTLAAWRVHESAGAWSSWILYGLLCVLSSLAHISAPFVAVGHAAFFTVSGFRQERRSRFFRRGVLTAGVVAGLLAPMGLSWVTAVTTETYHQVAKPFSVFAIGYALFVHSVGRTLGPSIYELQRHLSLATLRPHWPAVAATVLVFGATALVGLRAAADRIRKEDNLGYVLLGFTLLVPPLALYSIDAASSYTINPRHVTAAFVPYIALLASGLTHVRRSTGLALLSGIVLLSGCSLRNLYYDGQYAREDARGAAAYLNAATDPKGIVLVAAYPGPIRHYYDGPMPVVPPWPILGPDRRNLDSPRRMARALRRLTRGKTELFYVDLRAWQVDPGGRIPRTCAREFRTAETRAFHGVTVTRYTVR